jgi:hypothetical protein
MRIDRETGVAGSSRKPGSSSFFRFQGRDLENNEAFFLPEQDGEAFPGYLT